MSNKLDTLLKANRNIIGKARDKENNIGKDNQPEEDDRIAIDRHEDMDLVAGRYQVCIDQPLVIFNTNFADAFMVKDNQNLQDSEPLYALVFNKHFPTRLSAINKLKQFPTTAMYCPLEAGITMLSHTLKHYFIAILPLPRGRPLSDIMSTKNPISSSYIIKHIMPTMIKVLKHLSKLEITHGYIHPDNIYIDDYNNITLGECISSPCGYKQSPLFEPLEFCTALQVGKGEGNEYIDYYAFGILIFSLLRGSYILKKIPDSKLTELKFMKGSFNGIVDDFPVPEFLADPLQGLLHDKHANRWTYIQLEQWLKGKSFNLIRSSSHIEGKRSIIFNNRQFFNRKALAQHMSEHWELSRKFLKQNALSKWLAGSLNRNDDAKKILQLHYLLKKTNQVYGLDGEDEMVARAIMILDPGGPIRIKNLSVNIDAIGMAFAYYYAEGRTQELQYLSFILINKLITTKQGGKKRKIPHKILWNIEKCSKFLRNNALGFGVERCLYALNPELPCQNEEMLKTHVNSLSELLLVCNRLASEENEIPLDPHIFGYIAEQISLPSSIYIKRIAKFHELLRHDVLQSLAILTLGQQRSSVNQLYGIAMHMPIFLEPLINMFYSKSTRQEIVETITKEAADGRLIPIFKLMTNARMINKDIYGYKKAIYEYRSLTKKITVLDAKRSIMNYGYRYGLFVSLCIAYGISFVTLAIFLTKHF